MDLFNGHIWTQTSTQHASHVVYKAEVWPEHSQKVELLYVQATQALCRRPLIRKMPASRCNESWIWAFKTMPLCLKLALLLLRVGSFETFEVG